MGEFYSKLQKPGLHSSWCDSIHQVSLFHEEEDSEHTSLPLQVDDNDRFCIFSLRFSANGDEILGGANNGYIYVYDRFAQQRSLRIDAHDDDVNAVAFVDTATHILASGGKFTRHEIPQPYACYH